MDLQKIIMLGAKRLPVTYLYDCIINTFLGEEVQGGKQIRILVLSCRRTCCRHKINALSEPRCLRRSSVTGARMFLNR